VYPWPLAHELLGGSRDIARTDSRQSPIVSIYNCANWIWVHGFMNNTGNLRRKPLWSMKWVYRKSGHRLRYSEKNICLWLYRMAHIFLTRLCIYVACSDRWVLHRSAYTLARYVNTFRLKTELLLLKNSYLKLWITWHQNYTERKTYVINAVSHSIWSKILFSSFNYFMYFNLNFNEVLVP
jgi:hypothetical protein